MAFSDIPKKIKRLKEFNNGNELHGVCKAVAFDTVLAHGALTDNDYLNIVTDPSTDWVNAFLNLPNFRLASIRNFGHIASDGDIIKVDSEPVPISFSSLGSLQTKLTEKPGSGIILLTENEGIPHVSALLGLPGNNVLHVDTMNPRLASFKTENATAHLIRRCLKTGAVLYFGQDED